MTKLQNVYFVAGKVVKGFGRGSKQLGIPTANIESDVVGSINLENGIYYGFAQLLLDHQQMDCDENANDSKDKVANGIDKQLKFPIYKMVCSLGWNPHFGNTQRSLEVHILHNFGFDFYGANLRLAICGHIRDERKFNDLTELIDAIHSDIKIANNELDSNKKWEQVIHDNFFSIKS